MLNNTDLANAVSEGIISTDQARQLQVFSKRLETNKDSLLNQELETRDEPFRLLRGFRDIFIALGLSFFAFGATSLLSYLTNFSFTSILTGFSFTPIETSTLLVERSQLLSKTFGVLLLLIVGIILAEIITRRQRLPLSSLVLSLILVIWFASVGPIILSIINLVTTISKDHLTSLLAISWALSAFIGMILFYLRYRLPFVVFIIASAFISIIVIIIGTLTPHFLSDNIRLLTATLGVLVFFAAMSFDLKDRLRITRFSECGFWLHLLAAPLIVHSSLANGDFNEINPALTLSVFAVLTVVALVIDRRALLVSTLIYLSGAFIQIIRTLELNAELQFAFPIFLIGLLVISLGIGWTPLRRLIMAPLPQLLKDRLPPVASSETIIFEKVPPA